MFDVESNVRVHELLPAKARTATENGSSVDRQGFGAGRSMAVLTVGAVSGSSPTLDVKLQESDDDSTFTDITGATFTQKTAAGREVIAVDLRGVKRYIRAVATIGGTSPQFDSAVLLLEPGKYNPVTQPS